LIWYLLYTLIEVLGVLSAARAIMEVRTAQGAAAWAVFLVSFPLLALPLYWVFGRNRFAGYTHARQMRDALVRNTLSDLSERVASLAVHGDPEGREVDVVAAGLSTLPMLRGNDVELLVDGEATFASIIEGIEAASDYVLFQFFIIREDGLGNRIRDLLCRKARQGVRVWMLYDEVGSHGLSEGWLQGLREAGVRVSAFHSTRGRGNRFQLNFRNHRKVVVSDGRIAWIGGHNVGDEYLDGGERFERWRDTHVRIAGPAALAAQLSFAEDWHWATGRLMDGLNWTPACMAADRPVLVLPTGPADRLDTAALAFVDAINRARERLWIASPYFVPDGATMAALQLAALRGVDVRILIPDQPDHLLVYLAAFAFIGEAARSGVRFYRYTAGFMHQKVVLVDEAFAAIGTANFDNRSFRLNFEITAIVQDRAFAREVAGMLEADFGCARLMSPTESEEKPLGFRFASRLARLAAPVL